MVPIGWLIIMLGIAAIIDGYHGATLWKSLSTYLNTHGNTQAKVSGA